ncbi:MAG: serine/threonine protein kinase [Chloroflexota bacterium]|nr:serine/threonine protein kinase [Chloroflexota bacterium]
MAGIHDRQEVRGREVPVGRILRNGEYRVEAVLGHGGMGRVFLASHMERAKLFALKQVRADSILAEEVIAELDCALLIRKSTGSMAAEYLTEYALPPLPGSGNSHTDRFLREALLLLRLRHPAIPSLHDYFFEDGCWYLVIDYIAGPTLATYLRQQAPLPPLEALNYAMQFCDVLDYLHRQTPPVIFRDLKPANSMFAPGGRLMVIDFGIARYFKEGQVNDTLNFGSPGYASPEQYYGSGQTDARSDLFSLGIILHEMISGQHPSGHSQHLESVRQSNPALSPVLSALITIATRADPCYRFQSAHAFLQALERTCVIEERRAYQQRIHIIRSTRPVDTEARPVVRLREIPQHDDDKRVTGGLTHIKFAADSTPLPPFEPPEQAACEERKEVAPMKQYMIQLCIAAALLLVLLGLTALLYFHM